MSYDPRTPWPADGSTSHDGCAAHQIIVRMVASLVWHAFHDFQRHPRLTTVCPSCDIRRLAETRLHIFPTCLFGFAFAALVNQHSIIEIAMLVRATFHPSAKVPPLHAHALVAKLDVLLAIMYSLAC